MFKRILVIASCVALLVCSFALPASAAELDYNDYITNIQVDGDNDIVTVSFPVQNALYQLYDSSTNLLLSQLGSLNFYADSNSKYRIDIVPLWPDVIDLSNIPQGAVLALDFQSDASGLGFWDAVNLDVLCYLAFPYGSGTYWRSVRPVLSENFDPSFSFNLDKSDDNGSFFSAVDLQFSFHNIDFLDSGAKQLEAKSLTVTMSISSLYRLQQQTGKTNEILSEVEKQLADQGKTLDEVLGAQKDTNEKLDGIINDKVDSTPPSGGGAVGDLDDAEGQIRDDAQSGLDQGLDVQQSALQILQQYWSAFACVGWIFNKFADLPFFSGLLYVSFALGITGAILGLGLSISRSGSHSGYRRARSKGGKYV